MAANAADWPFTPSTGVQIPLGTPKEIKPLREIVRAFSLWGKSAPSDAPQILKKVFSLPFQSEVGGFRPRMFRCCRVCPHMLTLRLGGFIAAVRSGNRVGKHGTDGREPKSVGHGASSPTLFNGAGDRSPDVTLAADAWWRCPNSFNGAGEDSPDATDGGQHVHQNFHSSIGPGIAPRM